MLVVYWLRILNLATLDFGIRTRELNGSLCEAKKYEKRSQLYL